MRNESDKLKRKILLVYSPDTTFTNVDYEILLREHKVEKYQFVPQKGLFKVACEFIKQLLFLTTRIWSYDAVYIWFADYHSYLPVLFSKIGGKKSYIVIGGYDVANFPELKYGTLTEPLRKYMSVFSMQNATLCIPVVEQLEKKLLKICPTARTKTIHTGYSFKDHDDLDLNMRRKKMILTVSITENHQRFMIKGLDRFKELALLMPDYTFCIVGIKENAKVLFEPIPDNLIYYPPLKQEELTAFYLKAAYYAQFSRSEGLPNALCEAMLYGCVPLGVNVGGIGTAIENYGLVQDEWDASGMVTYLQQDVEEVDRNKISNHIVRKFDIRHRISKLLKTINV